MGRARCRLGRWKGVSELLSFPASKHDDQVDALGLVGQLLDRMVKGKKPQPVRPAIDKRQPTFFEAFKRHQKAMRRLREMEADA
jgi:hypothetical protein